MLTRTLITNGYLTLLLTTGRPRYRIRVLDFVSLVLVLEDGALAGHRVERPGAAGREVGLQDAVTAPQAVPGNCTRTASGPSHGTHSQNGAEETAGIPALFGRVDKGVAKLLSPMFQGFTASHREARVCTGFCKICA